MSSNILTAVGESETQLSMINEPMWEQGEPLGPMMPCLNPAQQLPRCTQAQPELSFRTGITGFQIAQHPLGSHGATVFAGVTPGA